MKITGAKVFAADHIFKNEDIYIKGDRIAEASSDDETFDASGLTAIPGLVDIHFHGAVGHDFCNTDLDGLRKIAEYEAQNGILAICPATMTYSEEILSEICERAHEYASKENESSKGPENNTGSVSPAADFVGINMEGPFISKDKIGAQNPKYLAAPNVDMFRRLQKTSGNLIKLVDIAPELDESLDFIREVSGEVTISLAHTSSDYDTATKAFNAGARHMTHLFNAMPGITHRSPGPIIAALENNAEVELIADGIHIHPAMVRFVFNTFSEDKVILIADSMEATGLPDGEYQLGGQEVTVKGNLAVLTENSGTIAGSVTNLYDCMKKAVKEMGVPLEKAIRASSENPAVSIGISKDYGSISAGKYANILLVDDDLNIKHIIQHGKLRSL
ncbi:N-acetylglucosamine-6-phosphate deacetylase [Butyrivibrio sp. NC2002]|uniref:N-acetylglucosamine-6-phosphate deacetylase n=1 Tax=Butyrivibrio sp. NC2002 TaxID=1410610 RepID=UPI00055C81C3|nr:N-acetylglucosamine-6-phosphate deacetylase [Butyrivibrio sp. NC2002]